MPVVPSDVVEVYTGLNGILANGRAGTVLIDFTTVGMDTSIQIATLALERGLAYLDAPVSGGPEGAAEGSLTIMVGGEQAAFEQVLPILQVLGRNIQHLGSTGFGSAAKLINQYLVAAHSLAAAEAMAAGCALGLQAEQLYEILKTSYGDSRMLRRHMEGHVLRRNFQPGGALKYLTKDVKLANRLIEQTGIKPSAGKSAEEVLISAIEQGFGDSDMSAIIRPIENQSGILVHSRKKQQDF